MTCGLQVQQYPKHIKECKSLRTSPIARPCFCLPGPVSLVKHRSVRNCQVESRSLGTVLVWICSAVSVGVATAESDTSPHHLTPEIVLPSTSGRGRRHRSRIGLAKHASHQNYIVCRMNVRLFRLSLVVWLLPMCRRQVPLENNGTFNGTRIA